MHLKSIKLYDMRARNEISNSLLSRSVSSTTYPMKKRRKSRKARSRSRSRSSSSHDCDWEGKFERNIRQRGYRSRSRSHSRSDSRGHSQEKHSSHFRDQNVRRVARDDRYFHRTRKDSEKKTGGENCTGATDMTRSPSLLSHSHNQRRKSGYGLQGKESTKGKYTSANIGPDPALISQKRQEKVSKMAGGSIGGSRRVMSAEEKADALRKMKSDAHVREAAIEVAVKSKLCEDKNDHEVSGNAVFLTEMANKAHGFESEATLSDRLTSKRHTSQQAQDYTFL